MLSVVLRDEGRGQLFTQTTMWASSWMVNGQLVPCSPPVGLHGYESETCKESSTLDTIVSLIRSPSWTLDAGRWTLDAGRWTLLHDYIFTGSDPYISK